mgnify:CR=1 FL=1
MSVIWWTPEQLDILKKLYPSKPKKEVLKELKPKTWYTIDKKAKELKLLRDPKLQVRQKKPPKQFLGKAQLTKMLEKDLTIEEIAKKLRSEPHIVRRYIQKYGL